MARGGSDWNQKLARPKYARYCGKQGVNYFSVLSLSFQIMIPRAVATFNDAEKNKRVPRLKLPGRMDVSSHRKLGENMPVRW